MKFLLIFNPINCSEKTRWEKEARIGVEEFRSLRLRNRQESEKTSPEQEKNDACTVEVPKSEKVLKLGKKYLLKGEYEDYTWGYGKKPLSPFMSSITFSSIDPSFSNR